MPGIKTTLFALAFFCLWALPTPPVTYAQGSSADVEHERSQPDPALERIWDLLSTDRPTGIDEAILAATGDKGTPNIQIDLTAQRLRLFVDDHETIVCPIASGHPTSRTPRGSFAVVATFENKEIPHRGVFLGADGKIIMADVDRKQDPMPVGASFEPRPVAIIIQLSEDGPTIQTGLATRTGTTSGDIRIPATAAETLIRFIETGTAVTIQ